MSILESYANRTAEREGSPVNRWESLARGIHCLLEEIRDGIVRDAQAGTVEALSIPYAINTDAGGNGQVEIGPAPGITWRLLAVHFQLTAGAVASGYIAAYRDQETGINLLKSAAIAAAVGESYWQPGGEMVPEHVRLLLVVRGGPVNSQVSGRIAAENTTYGRPQTTTHS